MKFSTFVLSALLATAGTAQASIIGLFTEDLDASTITIDFSGSIVLEDLGTVQDFTLAQFPFLWPAEPDIRLGAGGEAAMKSVSLPAFTYTAFGTGGPTWNCYGFSGTPVRMTRNASQNDGFDIAADYVSGTDFSASMTCDGTFASAGITPTTVVSTLPGNQTLTLNFETRAPAPVPLPAGLPLLAIACAAFGVAARRRRQ